MNKEGSDMGSRPHRAGIGSNLTVIIKFLIIAVTLIVIMAMMKGCFEQESKDSIEKQKYMTPLEKCIQACDSATTDGSNLETDCINQCFDKETG